MTQSLEQAMAEALDGTFTKIPESPRLFARASIMSLRAASGGLNMALISGAVAMRTGMTVHDMRRQGRELRCVRPRWMFFWLCRQHTFLSYPQIGRWCGMRDHSTVFHGVKKVQQNMGLYKADISAIEQMLGVPVTSYAQPSQSGVKSTI